MKAKELVKALEHCPETEVRIAHLNRFEICKITELVIARSMNSMTEPHVMYIQVQTDPWETKAWREGSDNPQKEV